MPPDDAVPASPASLRTRPRPETAATRPSLPLLPRSAGTFCAVLHPTPACHHEELSMEPQLHAFAVLALLAPAAAWAQPAAKPNDAQIAHIAYTADNIDIQMGQLALRKSKNAQVRDFAQEMVRDHTAVNDKALALVKKLGVQPQDNDTSRALQQAADAEMKR